MIFSKIVLTLYSESCIIVFTTYHTTWSLDNTSGRKPFDNNSVIVHNGYSKLDNKIQIKVEPFIQMREIENMSNEQVKVLLNKEYSGESIVDAERDLYECINHADDIPQDEYGFPQGTFTITVTFTSDNQE